MAPWSDLLGTTGNIFGIGIQRLKAITGGIAIRNAADSADTKIQASTLETSLDNILINYDAAGSGVDWTLLLARNPAQSAALTVQMPPAKSTDGFFIRQKASTGAGILEFELAAATAGGGIVDTTSIAFGTASPLTLFTTPAGAVIHRCAVVIDTPFNGTPTLTIGIAGTTAKYMGAGQNNLNGTAKDVYQTNPGEPAASEALIATYSAGGASVGAARILVFYSVPT